MSSRPLDLAHIASRVAGAGGEVILGGVRARGDDSLQTGEKGAGDYVTRVDLESERAVSKLLAELDPGVPVVGEEGGGEGAERYWLVDPLDGTANFLHGFPIVAVSVALIQDDEPVAGAVHAPFMGETYLAAKGAGSWLESRGMARSQLAVSEREPDRSIVGTGFPFRRKDLLGRYLPVFSAALERFEDLRRPGAAALDLAWVAAGVFEGFFELALAPWDVAAGALLIQEAGGVVTDWDGGGGYLSGNILAGSPAVHAELRRLASGT